MGGIVAWTLYLLILAWVMLMVNGIYRRRKEREERRWRMRYNRQHDDWWD